MRERGRWLWEGLGVKAMAFDIIAWGTDGVDCRYLLHRYIRYDQKFWITSHGSLPGFLESLGRASVYRSYQGSYSHLHAEDPLIFYLRLDPCQSQCITFVFCVLIST